MERLGQFAAHPAPASHLIYRQREGCDLDAITLALVSYALYHPEKK